MGRIEMAVIDGIAWVTIADEERANAIGAAMLGELASAWQAVEQRSEISAAILTGAGSRHFSSGAARDELRSAEFAAASELAITPRRAAVTKPVVAAVNGTVAGGALSLVADCDVVLAVRSASFVDTHVAAGARPTRTAASLARRLPRAERFRLLAGGTAAPLGAERAYTLGLVQELFDAHDAMRARARELATVFGSVPNAVLRQLRDHERHAG